MSSISLALIVRDAEKTIDKCLSTFKECVDEIIVVDTGSKDRTIEIVSKFTDKIYSFEWIDDFAAARNFSFEKCACDFIMWVDADDYILPDDAQKIKELDLSDAEIIICQYHYSHDEFGNTQLIVPRERIIKRSLNLKWEGAIHEYIPIVGYSQRITDIAIHHNKQHGTSERNLAILERVVAKNPETRNVYYLGKEYLEFGRIDDGIKWLTEFTMRKDWFWEDLFHAHDMLAKAYHSKGNDDMFFKHIFESIKIEPRRAEPFYELGWYYHLKNQWSRAIVFYEKCLSIKRPKELLSSYITAYYTWLPALQLCVCYNAIGDIEKAHEYNEMVLQYRPNDSRAINNKKILENALIKKEKSVDRKDGCGKKLNLGCGGKRIDGYINVDLFKGPSVDEVFELDEIPYTDNSISSVYSEHALEHLTFDRSEKAIKEWFRVLQPGGEVLLYMPDLEKCCQAYLTAPMEHKDFVKTKAWFKFTLYGIQKSQAGELDDSQIHKCGYSKDEIKMVFERNGFIVDYCENYGGPGQKPDYGTPSFGLRAVKPVSNIRVGWIAPVNWDAAQTRIRVLNIHRWLRSHGYWSEIVNYTDIVNRNFDLAIVGKAFDENHFTNIRWLKRCGKTVFCDLCEDILEFPWVREILSICDKIICCSTVLSKKVEKINPNTCVIEDAWEV